MHFVIALVAILSGLLCLCVRRCLQRRANNPGPQDFQALLPAPRQYKARRITTPSGWRVTIKEPFD